MGFDLGDTLNQLGGTVTTVANQIGQDADQVTGGLFSTIGVATQPLQQNLGQQLAAGTSDIGNVIGAAFSGDSGRINAALSQWGKDATVAATALPGDDLAAAGTASLTGIATVAGSVLYEAGNVFGDSGLKTAGKGTLDTTWGFNAAELSDPVNSSKVLGGTLLAVTGAATPQGIGLIAGGAAGLSADTYLGSQGSHPAPAPAPAPGSATEGPAVPFIALGVLLMVGALLWMLF